MHALLIGQQYGSLRTASYRKGMWRSKQNWKHAWTLGGGKATLGALSLMGLSMGFDMLISTPLEKKYDLHFDFNFYIT